MDVYKSGYYKNVRIYMSCVGLWPYDDSRSRIFIQCLIILILYTSLILQISGFLLLPYSTEMFLKFSIRIAPSIFSGIAYTLFWIQQKEMKELFDQIRNDCNLVLLRNLETKKMVKECAKNVKQKTSLYFYIFICTVITQACFLILPFIWDKTVPIHEPKIYKYPVSIGYYEKFQSNFAITFIALCCIPITEGIVSLTVATVILHFIEHSCMMFSLNGYLLEHSFVEKESKSGVKKNVKIYKILVTVINNHNKNIRFLNDINNIFEKNNLCGVFFSLCILVIEILYLFDIKYMLFDYREVIMNISLFLAHLFFLFTFCYEGQCVSNHGVDFFMKVYNYPWYATPPKIQRMYLLILMKSIDPTYISVGKVFKFSYEFIASMLNTSISYALVFHSR